MPLSKIQSGMRDNITNSELPDIQASDLDITTQGVGLAGWEHIETRVAKSDGDTNFQNGTGNAGQNATAAAVTIDLRTLKTRYQCYKIYFHLVHTGTSALNMLWDTVRMDLTSTNNSTWYGGAVLQDNTSGSQNTLTRYGSTTQKIMNNVWARGSSTRNYHGGVMGEMDCMGFHTEVSANMDGFDHRTFAETTSNAAEVTNTGYRTYYAWRGHTYNTSVSLYQGVYGTTRQNQTFYPSYTTGTGSFGGFMFLSNTSISGANYNFAQGSYFSIYGLRMPTGD